MYFYTVTVHPIGSILFARYYHPLEDILIAQWEVADINH